MRGSPLWQVLAVVVAFATMGLPVWRLTRPVEAEPVHIVPSPKELAERKAAAETALTMDVEANFAPAPSEFSLSYLGTPLLQGKQQAKATAQIKTTMPTEGADLVLHVTWPATGQSNGAAAAARVMVNLSDGRQVEKSFWSVDGTALDSALSVPGKTADATP